MLLGTPSLYLFVGLFVCSLFVCLFVRPSVCLSIIVYLSALKFQLQIERPWGHDLSCFRSKTGFQKWPQGPHFVANKLFWGCVWVYMVRLCNHLVAALFWITCDNIRTPKHFVAMCFLPRKAFCSFWRWQVVKKKTDWIATKWPATKQGIIRIWFDTALCSQSAWQVHRTPEWFVWVLSMCAQQILRTYPNNIRTSDPHIATKWISHTKFGDQFRSYKMICTKAINNMLDDEDKKYALVYDIL